MHLDPDQSKAALMTQLIELQPGLSPSKAGRLAAKIQRGYFDPTPLQYADETGETAVNNVLRNAA